MRTLRTMLEASIAIDDVQGGAVLGEAIADHRQSQVERAVREEYAAGPVEWPDTLVDLPVEPEPERELELHSV